MSLSLNCKHYDTKYCETSDAVYCRQCGCMWADGYIVEWDTDGEEEIIPPDEFPDTPLYQCGCD